MTINSAVIPVAGIGTRAFPLTTTIEKSLLPIYAGSYSRPIVDFMVEDCVNAGITRIIFITSEHGKIQLNDYFGPLRDDVAEQLRVLHKENKLEVEYQRRLDMHIDIEYIVQPLSIYGTTVPLYLAQDALKGEENFIMMGGDDFVYHTDNQSELKLALQTWENSLTDHVIMGAPVRREDAVKYAILQSDSTSKLTSIEEKPPLEHIPDNPTVNITRYLFNKKIWDPVNDEMKMTRNGAEHYITYVISDALQRNQTFQIHPIHGKYLDGGTYEGLFEASKYIQAHPKI